MADSQKSTKDCVKDSVKEFIEIIDDIIIGEIMDIPIVNKLEEKLVEVVIDALWIQHEGTPIDNTFLPWSA